MDPILRVVTVLAAALLLDLGCDPSRPVPSDLGSTVRGEARPADGAGDGKPPVACAAPIELWDISCFQFCEKDGDCVRAQANCCPCASGGSQAPIHKGWTATFAFRFANCSGPVGCPAVHLCDSCTDGNTSAPLACKAGRCTILCP